ncbi:MAG: hypothetical protein FWC68_04655 [Oscillospiraceae bacterium]|nr:hypothetical protein [Oscillospiraceae bacterium]
MDLYGVGFSVIRLPNESNNLVYIYDPRINVFPEEVFLHEFLHTLERLMREHGYTIPDLHDYAIYGYRDERPIGLREWYRDYMTQSILDSTTNEYIGLYPIVYSLKPVHASNFAFPREIPFVQESGGIVRDIRNILGRAVGVFR